MDSSNKRILPPYHRGRLVQPQAQSVRGGLQILYTDTPRTRSSASSSNPGWKYRVFLSFYGEDTRKSFINHLLASLEDKWSLVFGNDDSLEHGKYLCQKLLKALQESICAIVVISKAHAFSKRCLVELTEILKCRTETELKVFPIFYHGNPSDVQYQKGDVERALAVHRESPEVDGQQMKAWRTALREVGGLVDGWRVLDDRYLAGIIEDIKENILRISSVEGTNAVRGIVLNLPLQERIQLNIEAFSYMQGLRMLVIRGLYSMSTSCLIDDLHTVKWYGNLSKFILSNQLCILEWWGYPLTSLPTNFEPHNLVELIMQQSCIEYLWMGGKVFEKLKHIDLIKSQNLIKTPDFNEVPNLEVLELGHCTSLCMVHPSIGVLKELKRLNLRGCVSLESLPSEVGCLRSLEVLDLSGNNFSQIPDSVWQLADLQELYLEDCSQLKLLSKLPFRLGHLHLRNCPSLYCFCDQLDTMTSSDIWNTWDTIDISFSSVHFHHGKPYRILHLHQRIPLRIKLRAQIFDTFVACGLTMECGTPEWFNQRSTPSFGSIGRRMDLDLDEDSEDWKGCAIFIDFEIHEHGNSNTRMSNGSNHTFLYFVCRFQTEEVSLREPLVLGVPEVPPSGRHGVWAYIPAEWFGERRNNLARWSRLEVSNATQNLNVRVRVNHCGLRLVRQHDLSGMYEALRSISPHFPDLQGWENLFYRDLETLRVSGPIEGNIMLEKNIRPTCRPLEKKRKRSLDYLSDEERGSISPHVWDAIDNLSDEEPESIPPRVLDASDR